MVCGGGCHVTPCLSSRPFCGNPRTIPQKKSQAVVNPVESHVCFELTFFWRANNFHQGVWRTQKGVTKTGGDDNHFLIFVPLSSDFCREVLWGRQPSTITQCAGKNVGRGINFSTFVQFSVRPLETCINPPLPDEARMLRCSVVLVAFRLKNFWAPQLRKKCISNHWQSDLSLC